jgi:hypothetical protein
MLIAAAAAAAPLEQNLKSDEYVILFPAMAVPAEDGSWRVTVHAWIHEHEGYVALLPALAAALGFEDDVEAVVRNPIFRARARWFLVDNERGKRLAVRMGRAVFTLHESQPDGHLHSEFVLSPEAVAGIESQRKLGERESLRSLVTLPRFAPLEAVTEGDGPVRATAAVHVVKPRGVSIICDIDDTLKISDVRDREALLRNTFLREFEAVPGMPALLTKWAADDSVVIHYVSASPWQLYPPLSAFFETAGYPAGLWHMKSFRWSERSFFNLWLSPVEYKTATIEPILRRFPARRFVLVGDSGEMDPEAYGDLARRHADQVSLILIRDVSDEPRVAERYQKAFEGVSPERWFIFREAREIEDKLRPDRTSTEPAGGGGEGVRTSP